MTSLKEGEERHIAVKKIGNKEDLVCGNGGWLGVGRGKEPPPPARGGRGGIKSDERNQLGGRESEKESEGLPVGCLPGVAL